LPGDSDTNYAALFAMLRRYHYRGSLVVETAPNIQPGRARSRRHRSSLFNLALLLNF
jgi:sugar phosphate isomerase/epimerase